jgi:ribosomal peptide maturation radical SAM protein 1
MSADQPAEVCLVAMPYSSLAVPSVALGLLKGILTEGGVRTVVADANLWFADAVGLGRYQFCANGIAPELLPGEWTFAGAAFDQDDALAEEYLELMGKRPWTVGDGTGATSRDPVDDLRVLRMAATEFTDTAARRVLATGARVIGCTSTFAQHVPSLALLRRVRELDPGVITLIGGANCEGIMGQTTHRCFPWVDYLVSGEADGLITDLCRLLLTRGRDVAADELPAGVLGPCHRNPCAAVSGSTPGSTSGSRSLPVLHRNRFRDLDRLPLPLFDDYFDTLATLGIRHGIRPALPIETSRGCWWGSRHQCTFCGLNGNGIGYDAKSGDRVLHEIRELESRYGIHNFQAVDNIMDMSYFTDVLPKLAADGTPRRLFYEVKANLSRKQIETLVDAGVIWVQPGIENLHTNVLKIMNKGVKGWQNIQLLRWAREFGLRMSWSILWNFPGEDDNDYQQMARWAPLLEHLQPPNNVVRLRYHRYSVYQTNAARDGLVLKPLPSMRYVYPLPEEDLIDLTYFFTTEATSSVEEFFLGSDPELAERPGVQALRAAMREWHKAARGVSPTVLSLLDRDGALDILDTRRITGKRRLVLRGTERAVYIACESAPRADRIGDVLRRDHDIDLSDERVADIVETLVGYHLVLPIDGRLIGLCTREPVRMLPTFAQFPGGHVDERFDTAERPELTTRSAVCATV